MYKTIESVFHKIEQLAPLDEIAYLAIEDGELIPVYKRDTVALTNADWQAFHSVYRSFVKDSPFLQHMVDTGEPAIIENTDALPQKPIEFQKLDIKSIYLFPVCRGEVVVGVLDMAYRVMGHRLSKEVISAITALVQREGILLEGGGHESL